MTIVYDHGHKDSKDLAHLPLKATVKATRCEVEVEDPPMRRVDGCRRSMKEQRAHHQRFSWGSLTANHVIFAKVCTSVILIDAT